MRLDQANAELMSARMSEFVETPAAQQMAVRKARAMHCFASQLAQQPYADQVAGLNRQRSYTLGPAVTSAEAFWFVDRADLAGGFDGLAASVAQRLRQHD